MMKRCRHRWDVVGRAYSPPHSIEFKSAGGSALDVVDRLMSGWTTVSLRCSVCGDVAARQIIGRWSEDRTPFEWADKPQPTGQGYPPHWNHDPGKFTA